VIDPKDKGDLAIPHSVPHDLVSCGPRQAAIAEVVTAPKQQTIMR